MNRKRVLLFCLLAVAAAVGAVAAWNSFTAEKPHYREVPPGCQEIAFLAPATSADSWERVVAGADALVKESQAGRNNLHLHIDKQRAFVEQTAEIPEIALWVDGCEDQRLLLRWYKLSGGSGTRVWVGELSKRLPPPLAFIGGDTTNRARLLGESLRNLRGHWQGQDPLLLITTATADRFVPKNLPNTSTTTVDLPQLIEIYKGSSFRFAFTNSRMAEVILDFVSTHDNLWPRIPPQDVVAAALVAQSNPLDVLAMLPAAKALLGYKLYAVRWLDDSYSVDLANRFSELVLNRFEWWQAAIEEPIDYSVGEIYHANPPELRAIERNLLPEIQKARNQRQLMLLPTSDEEARRFLRTLLRIGGRPDMRNLVVLTGDSISFNTIYRDHDVAWNIRDLEVPLVMFGHTNPIDATVGFRKLEEADTPSESTSTSELLLYRDILEALLRCAYRKDRATGALQLTDSAAVLRLGLHELRWADGRIVAPWMDAPSQRAGRHLTPLFTDVGNRSNETGEHVIVMRPEREERDDISVLPGASIAVWRLGGGRGHGATWTPVAPALFARSDGRH